MALDVQHLYDGIVGSLKSGDDNALRLELETHESADIAEVMELLEDEERSRILHVLSSRVAAEVFILLHERVRDEVVEDFGEGQLARIITELEPDDAADVVGELTEEEGGRVLDELPPEQSEEIEQLLEYDEDTAGGMMTPHVIGLPGSYTVREARHFLRKTDIFDEEVFHTYTTDQAGRLSGVVAPRRLLLAEAQQKLDDIRIADPISVGVEADAEEIIKIFRKYDLTSLPVVNQDNRLVGMITIDDVIDVQAEEAEEDFYFMAGTEDAPSILMTAMVRFGWLLPSFIFMTGTALVIAFSRSWFRDVLSNWSEVQLALTSFVPMIGALAGCCSVQSSTVITRGLATGELAASRFFHVFRREGYVALMMAPACAIVAWILTRLCFTMPMLARALELPPGTDMTSVANAVGAGMFLGIVVASSLGISSPFLFRRCGIDPAIAAGPVVTAANDVISVSVYFFTARWVVQL